MSPSHVVEPTYRRLKQELMAGAWPPGSRLEAVRLAAEPRQRAISSSPRSSR